MPGNYIFRSKFYSFTQFFVPNKFLESTGISKEVILRKSKMLKPKTLNPKLQTCHQFILLEQINFAKVNKIRKVTN